MLKGKASIVPIPFSSLNPTPLTSGGGHNSSSEPASPPLLLPVIGIVIAWGQVATLVITHVNT